MAEMRLIGGPCHGQRIELERPRAVVHSAYRDSDRWDADLGITTYRVEEFVTHEPDGRAIVVWRKWRIYLWEGLPVDEATALRYRDTITEVPPDDRGWRPSTPAEQAAWDWQQHLTEAERN